MELISFCRAHGILIDSPPPIGYWRRYPTEDHPTKRNGAVKFMGDHAFVQNHAMDTEVSIWKPDTPVKINHAQIARELDVVEKRRNRGAIRMTNQKQIRAAFWQAFPDLLDALCTALPFVEDHEGSDIYKAGAVARAVREIRAVIKAATGEA